MQQGGCLVAPLLPSSRKGLGERRVEGSLCAVRTSRSGLAAIGLQRIAHPSTQTGSACHLVPGLSQGRQLSNKLQLGALVRSVFGTYRGVPGSLIQGRPAFRETPSGPIVFPRPG